MKTFSERLVFAMSKRNMKQADLVKKTGINKGALSSYINGRYEPKQNNIYLLSKALNVNEAWLMGYDVPMDQQIDDIYFGTELQKILENISVKLDLPINIIKTIFLNLNIDANLVLNYNNVLSEIEKYLINKVNINWDNESKQLENDINTFEFLANEIGWSFSVDEATVTGSEDEFYCEYIFSNGTLSMRVTNDEYSKLIDIPKKSVENALINLAKEKLDPNYVVDNYVKPKITIPYYLQVVSAGTGQFVFDDIPPEMIEIDDTPTNKKVSFSIAVNGNSMEPTFSNGDKLLVKKQKNISVGEIGIFMINGEAFVKELGQNKLISHNKKYSDIEFKENMRIDCIGKVIGKLEK